MMTVTAPTETLPESANTMIGWAIAESLRFADANGLTIRYNRKRLEAALNDPEKRDTELSLDFYSEEFDTHINLWVDRNWEGREFRDAENGDRMSLSTYRVKLNHPTHGSMDVGQAKGMFAFWSKVAELAEVLFAQVDGKKFESLSMTKADRDKLENDNKASRSEAAYQKAVEDACKGQRLGGSSRYLLVTPEMLPFTEIKKVSVRKNNIVYTYDLHSFGTGNHAFAVEAFLTNKAFSLAQFFAKTVQQSTASC